MRHARAFCSFCFQNSNLKQRVRVQKSTFSRRDATPIWSRYQISTLPPPLLFSLAEVKGRLLKMASVRFLLCSRAGESGGGTEEEVDWNP